MNPTLAQILLVGLGGFLGSSARFVLSGWVHQSLPQTGFPYGTLAVNVLGCLVIGILGGQMELRQALGPSQRLFLLIGVLGGFTTFSSFAYETMSLAHAADFLKVAGNVTGHLVLGLGAAWLGYGASQALGGG